MGTDFRYFSKFMASFEIDELNKFFKENNDIKDFNETSLFDENHSFNNDLLTKEGFVNALFDISTKDEDKKLTKEQLEKLYDSIAGMDGKKGISKKELGFFASLGEDDNKKGVIDKSDIIAFTAKKEIREVEKFNPMDNPEYVKYLETNPNATYDEFLEDYAKKHPDRVQTAASADELSKREMKHETFEETVHDKVSSKNIKSVNKKLKINGKIDENVIQGRDTGDCWLIAGINAINATDKGKQIIRNSIIPNQDGTVTVNFAGYGKSYTITQDEINKYDTDLNIHDKYSNGDNDMLVLELAMDKLIEENPDLMKTGDGINGGYMENLWKALTPNYKIETFDDNDNSKGIPQEDIYRIFKDALKNKNIAIGFGFRGRTESAKLIDGKDYEYSTAGAHVLAITSVKDNEITFNNSSNGQSYTMTWEEFVKLKPAGFFSIDLTEA